METSSSSHQDGENDGGGNDIKESTGNVERKTGSDVQNDCSNVSDISSSGKNATPSVGAKVGLIGQCFFLAALFVYGTSMMPNCVGPQLYLFWSSIGNFMNQMLSGAFLMTALFFYFVLDVSFWKSRVVKRVWEYTIALSTTTTLLLFTNQNSLIPFLVSFSIIPTIPIASRSFCGFAKTSSMVFAKSLIYPALIVGAFVLVHWLQWVFSSSIVERGCGELQTWNEYTRETAYYEMQCPFEIEVISFHENTETTVFYYCDFSEGCIVNGTIFRALDIDPVMQVDDEDGFCRFRTRQMLENVASYLISEGTDILNSTLNVVGEEGASNSFVIDTSMHDRILVKDGDDISKSFRLRFHGCQKALLVWMAPFIAGIGLIWLGTILLFLVSDVVSNKVTPSHIDCTSSAQESNFVSKSNLNLMRRASINAILPKAKSQTKWKYFSRLLVFLCFGLWTGASIGGADMNLSNTVIIFSMTAIFLAIVAFIGIYGWLELLKFATKTSTYQRVTDYSGNDWVKALIVLFFSQIFAVIIGFSFLNQAARKAKLFPCTREVSEQDRKIYITRYWHERILVLKKWPWTSILTKTILLSALYMAMNVAVAKFTSVFMSVLNAWLSSIGLTLGEVTGIFYAFGIVVFLNPLIPGVPVYVSGGIILVEAAQQYLGFWPAILYTTFICTLLKFTAIFVQQKFFGERLGNYVSIRKFIGVNSSGCRAIKLILQERGFTTNKVLVLCGGPDWPTSVTTGILRLSFPQMLLGSTPIVFLIFPCVISGGFLLRENESPVWSSMSVLSIGVAFLVQSASMIGALNAIASVARERQSEIDAMPLDEEVLAYEKRCASRAAALKVKMDWHRPDFPFWIKSVLVLGAFCGLTSFGLGTSLGSLCFESFSVSDDFELVLGGNALNLIKYPFGYLCMGCFFLSVLCYLMIEVYFSRCVKLDSIVPLQPAEAGKINDSLAKSEKVDDTVPVRSERINDTPEPDGDAKGSPELEIHKQISRLSEIRANSPPPS